LTDIFKVEPIPEAKMMYLEARSLLRLHDFILRHFEMEQDKGLDQATIVRRLGMDRGQLSRMLGVSGNWTIKSVTRLAAAIGGEIDYVWLPFPKLQKTDPSEETVAAMNKDITKKRRAPIAPPPQRNKPPQRNQPQPGPLG